MRSLSNDLQNLISNPTHDQEVLDVVTGSDEVSDGVYIEDGEGNMRLVKAHEGGSSFGQEQPKEYKQGMTIGLMLSMILLPICMITVIIIFICKFMRLCCFKPSRRIDHLAAVREQLALMRFQGYQVQTDFSNMSNNLPSQP